MEYRSDLADILLAGLPEGERRHVARVIREGHESKLARKRASREPAVQPDETGSVIVLPS